MNSILLLLATFMVSRLTGPHKQVHKLETANLEDQHSIVILPLKTLSHHVQCSIRYRYAKTTVSSKVYNPSRESQEAVFTTVLPETAFISSFVMNMDEIEYTGFVKEKLQAKHKFPKGTPKKKSTHGDGLRVRDANRFTISVQLASLQSVFFNLTFEELLVRSVGNYSYFVNLDPGEVVEDFVVSVDIRETSGIETINVSPLMLSNGKDLDLKEDETGLEVETKKISPGNVMAWFAPTAQQQREISKDGIKGQFVVYYDLERKKDMEVVVDDGYFARYYSRFFAHFFAPTHLKPLQKHITFVMDTSDSQGGNKISQLKKVMEVILGDLNSKDYFSLITYSNYVQVWKLNASTHRNTSANEDYLLDNIVLKAKHENTVRAMYLIEELEDGGLNNLYEALRTAFLICHEAKKHLQRISNNNHVDRVTHTQPMVVLLTDGVPKFGELDVHKIFKRARRWNAKTQAAIFALAIGDKANLEFLKRLSQDNSGFAVRVHPNSNVEVQLVDYYRRLSAPLLSNIVFTYNANQVNASSLTGTRFGTFFSGSEIVVAGKLLETMAGINLRYTVVGQIENSVEPFYPQSEHDVVDHGIENKPGLLERLWAYLRIQKTLDGGNCMCGKKQAATAMAVKYSFVTPVTSMVLVRPDGRMVRAVVESADKITHREEDSERKREAKIHYKS